MLYLTEYASPLGKMTIVCNEIGLAGAWIEGQKYFASTLKEEPVRIDFKVIKESGISESGVSESEISQNIISEGGGSEGRISECRVSECKTIIAENKEEMQETKKESCKKQSKEQYIEQHEKQHKEQHKEQSEGMIWAIKNLRNAVDWLERYFRGKRPEIQELVLAPQGSEFRQLVWKNLCEIPYGEVISYGELAKRVAAQMGKEKMSAQAIGGAVGHNPISVIIPCHRVVGADGTLTGYAGGIEKKKWLLELERGASAED